MSTPEPSRRLAVSSLVLGGLGLFTFGCLGIGGLVGVGLGVLALVRANQQPALYGGQGLAIGGIVANVAAILIGIPLAGIVAAIAIPSLLRARVSANEAAAIGDTRTFISAQAAYQATNEGFYEGNPACLSTPTQCLPNYPATSPKFLDLQISSLETRTGYRRSFHPGPDPASAGLELPEGASPSSVRGFAYVAVPLASGQTGIRGFCGDASGLICYTSDGTAPAVLEDGSCDPSSCQPLN